MSIFFINAMQVMHSVLFYLFIYACQYLFILGEELYPVR